ncbi:Alpha/Beta hydrolase protein [Obelidium mucronatum]|nr:Alpha/Beta hydrolase protein [Obelidium mucronatum]
MSRTSAFASPEILPISKPEELPIYDNNFANVTGAGALFEQLALDIASTNNCADIIRKWGYTCQVHRVLTKDNVLLTTHRIQSRNKFNQNKTSPPILLWHGFGGSGNCFVCAPERNSNLPFHLIEKGGFDIWLGNARGPLYTDFTLRGSKIFSIDDIVQHDIPAVVDYITKYTSHPKLIYIGISQGTTSIFGALSIHSELNKRIHLVIALAPTLRPSIDSIAGIVFPLFQHLGANVANNVYLHSTMLFKDLIPSKISSKIVGAITQFGFKWDFSILGSDTRLVPLVAHAYHGTSREVIDHWLQTMKQDISFSYYQRKSLDLFNPMGHQHVSPVRYPTKHITVPIHLFYSLSDSITDITQLTENLPAANTSFVEIKEYSHFEFLFGKDAKQKVFDPIADIIIDSLPPCGSSNPDKTL